MDNEEVVREYKERIIREIKLKNFSNAKKLVVALAEYMKNEDMQEIGTFMLWAESFFIEAMYEGKNKSKDYNEFLDLQKSINDYNGRIEVKLAKILAYKDAGESDAYKIERERLIAEQDRKIKGNMTSPCEYYEKMVMLCYLEEEDIAEKLKSIYDDATLLCVITEEYERDYMQWIHDVAVKREYFKRPRYENRGRFGLN